MNEVVIEKKTMDWTWGFCCYPKSMIRELMEHRPEHWTEITPPKLDDRVYLFTEDYEGKVASVTDNADKSKTYAVVKDNGSTVTVTVPAERRPSDYLVPVHKEELPAWSTLWAFSDYHDREWIKDLAHQELMAKYGFRLYYHTEWGYFFGIDGSGYSFTEVHWIPLYKACILKEI